MPRKNRAMPAINKVRHLEQYSGPFCMEPGKFNAALEYVNSIDIGAHVAAAKPGKLGDDEDDFDGEPDTSMDADGICCISCCGTMMKYGSSLSNGVSTVLLRQAVRSAANNPECKGIMMRYDSPGGSADGTEELASEIASAATKKPVWSYVDGMAASAAYWACCQSETVVAAPASMVGSIGTYGKLIDRSAQFAASGVKAIVIRAGEMKGAGTPGTEVTPEQIADYSRVINEINDIFVAAVAKGRKLSAEDAKALNDGRVHVGANAKAKRLVDQVGSFESAMDGLRAVVKARAPQMATKIKPGSSAWMLAQAAAAVPIIISTETIPAPALLAGAQCKEHTMPETVSGAPTAVEPKPAPVVQASLKELKAKFPQATADWREKCQEDGLTISQAGDRWMETLAAENKRLADELASAKKPAAPVTAPAGNKPLASSAAEQQQGTSGDARQQLQAIAAEKVKNGTPRARAWAEACKENEPLRLAMCDAHTDAYGAKVQQGRQ